jgi:hypothetical protein
MHGKMEANIKCMECKKGTRHFELGLLIYDLANSDNSLLIKDAIICPKCKKDISNQKCMVKTNEIMMSMIAANLCRSSKISVPMHLRNTYPLDKKNYNAVKSQFKSKLYLVDKF